MNKTRYGSTIQRTLSKKNVRPQQFSNGHAKVQKLTAPDELTSRKHNNDIPAMLVTTFKELTHITDLYVSMQHIKNNVMQKSILQLNIQSHEKHTDWNCRI